MKRIGIVCTQAAQSRYFDAEQLSRLEELGDVSWLYMPGSSREASIPNDPENIGRLLDFVPGLDVLVVSYGSPRVTERVLDAAGSSLRMVGDTHGDRFADRIDVEAANRRGVVAVDTTNGSSGPVAEWALALILIGLRNAASHFRRLIAGETLWPDRDEFLTDPGYLNGELRGKTVGLIALGIVGRHLVELLRPFKVTVLAYDPHSPDVMADACDLDLVYSLRTLLAESDVVVNLVPLTTETRGLLGSEEFAHLKPGAVFVNVSRGGVVDTAALISRLESGDIVACLDVVEPEPLPAGSPLRRMPNVFLSPHVAGVTANAEGRFFEYMVDEIERVLRGRRPHFPLRPRMRPSS